MTELQHGKSLSVRETPIPGFLVLDLPVHGDNRGWFKENWQREKMLALGLEDFAPVQNNISFNATVGVTRGIHAEPWDKFISVASGRVFGAWVDLREGPTFGTTFTCEIDPTVAVFVPRGVGNAFQSLEENTAYTYLVNDHWSADKQAEYTFLNLADPTVSIDWPIPLERSELSEKDKNHPLLDDVRPMPRRRTLVVGSNGQLGRAFRELWADREDVDFTTRNELDISSADSVEDFDFSPYQVIVNAGAYTAVDNAETPEGREAAWATNVTGVGRLVAAARSVRARLVQVSSDYVFDGTRDNHIEDEPLTPLGVYGQTKAAGDRLVETYERHYIARTSWVVGDGMNFVRTMIGLAEKGLSPTVVADQIGRLSFTEDIAKAIDHLLSNGAPFGTYNVTNTGEPGSWADIAADVYEIAGRDRNEITPVTTTAYYEGKSGIAPRPLQSSLDLTKLEASGFVPRDQFSALSSYVTSLSSQFSAPKR